MGDKLVKVCQIPKLGSEVLVYLDSRTFAFKGKLCAVHIDGKTMWIHYDNGGAYWAESKNVHGYVTM